MIFTSLKYSFACDNFTKDSILTALKNRFPHNRSIQSFTTSVGVDDGLGINSIVPNISLNDANGVKIESKSINYNYMLIDFWASWCGPCRVEEPNLLKTFETFKKAGFRVLCISLDADVQNWKEAIKADRTTEFVQLIDTNASKSFYLKEFKVTFLPYNFLIDKNGRIVGKNLFGQNLYQTIASLTQ